MAPCVVAHVHDACVVLFQPGGTVCRRRRGERGGPQGRSLLPGTWTGEHDDAPFRPPGQLRLWPVGRAWTAVRRWEDGAAAGWYVNLELPWRAFPLGFDSRDLTLDVTVADDLSSWAWKDEDELAWGLEHGVIAPEEAELARRAGEEAIALVEARRWPFDPDDDVWRAAAPDPAWPVPVVPSAALRL